MAAFLHPAASTGTLAAGVAGVVTLDLSTARRIAVTIANTGVTNAIGTTVISRACAETALDYATDTQIGVDIGSIALSSVASFEIDGNAMRWLKVTMTSASGSTYRVTLRGIDL